MQLAAAVLAASLGLLSQGQPDWCRELPRPVYNTLERVNVPDQLV